MIKVFKNKSLFKYVEVYSINEKNKVRISFDYIPQYNEKGEETDFATWIQFVYDTLPSKETLKSTFDSVINKQVQKEILEGFVWNGYNVWLSQENQSNYASAYLAKTLPYTAKFTKDNETVYYTFETEEELKDFYTKSIEYIQGVLKAAWNKKDSIDYSKYEL